MSYIPMICNVNMNTYMYIYIINYNIAILIQVAYFPLPVLVLGQKQKNQQPIGNRMKAAFLAYALPQWALHMNDHNRNKWEPKLFARNRTNSVSQSIYAPQRVSFEKTRVYTCIHTENLWDRRTCSQSTTQMTLFSYNRPFSLVFFPLKTYENILWMKTSSRWGLPMFHHPPRPRCDPLDQGVPWLPWWLPWSQGHSHLWYEKYMESHPPNIKHPLDVSLLNHGFERGV